jgi:hypothetical protein
VAATAKSIVEIKTASTGGAVILAWSVTFDGVTATNTPVKIEVGRFSAAVTTNATSITPSKVSYGFNGIASTATVGANASTEGAGTASDVEIYRVPPTSGLVWQESLGMEWVVPASGFFRIRCTAAQAVNATFTLRWTE